MRVNLPVTQRNYDFPADEMLVSMTNLKGELTHCNPAFARVSGFTYDELMGQPHNIIRHPDMPAAAFKDVWSTIGRGKPWTGMVKNRRKDGDTYWVWPISRPFLCRAGPGAICRCASSPRKLRSTKPRRCTPGCVPRPNLAASPWCCAGASFAIPAGALGRSACEASA
ncbi:PAS domain-containing protein [Comamonas flocculans]|uniref:PAS domain-containing protein n=1 Tax=Comamonas flocculans TaxID=2597701 RepID=A0A5B8RVE5_9BURK|nr:PAS domain-containing protein [Comamonas flocculans]